MTDYTYTGSIQTDDITVSGTYAITATGAAGGYGGDGAAGGLGAALIGDIYLAAGTVLEIITGGMGGSPLPGAGGGGGGGGSFVIETNNGTSAVDIVLAAAGGGGGGGGGSPSGGNGGSAQTSATGGNAYATTGGGGNLVIIDGGNGGGGGEDGGGRGGGGGGGVNGGGGGPPSSGYGVGVGGGGQSAGFGGGAAGSPSGGSGGYGGGGGGGSRSFGGGGGGGGGYAGGGGGYGGSGGFGGGGGGSYDEDLTGATFTLNVTTSNGDGDVTVSSTPICYLAGTHIVTPTGPAPVEALQIGDTVVTRFGGIRAIKWIGRQSFAPRFIAPDKFPVRITAGALSDQLPARDLFVSPGHSMLLGEILVLAKNLVNGITITQSQPTSEVAYFQLDLGTHDCVLAEGAWSETYADAPGLRAQFHNAAEFQALYPEIPPPEDLKLCAPRPEHGPRLEAALRPIAEIAAEARMNEPSHRRMG